jgi:hypothetical protein
MNSHLARVRRSHAVRDLCKTRLLRKIAASGLEGRRPGKILAGGDNHRLPAQPASRPGGAAEDNYLSNSRPSSAPPGRVFFRRLTGGCHHRLISSDPPGQQKCREQPGIPIFAEISVKMAVTQPRVARGTRPTRLPWVGVYMATNSEGVGADFLFPLIQLLQSWFVRYLPRVGAAALTLGCMITTPLGLPQGPI